MFSPKRITPLLALVSLVITLSLTVFAYIPSSRDTNESPETYSYDIKDVSEYVEIHETDNFKYFYREDRDVIAIKDKRNDYTWLTGLDIPYGTEVKKACDVKAKDSNSTIDEIIEACKPYDTNMNDTYTTIANSLLTIEYFDNANSIVKIGSSDKLLSSKLLTVNNQSDTRILEVTKSSLASDLPNIKIKLRIKFTNKGLEFAIHDNDIEGVGQLRLASLIIAPFLGASGGYYQYFDPITKSYDRNNLVKKPSPSGYVLVPDGPGALIRFKDNDSKFKSYVGEVYGQDFSTNYNYIEYGEFGLVPIKNPTLPVFGISHGDDTQNAFVAYATSGDEYMQIVVNPSNGVDFLSLYTMSYPRFILNKMYYRVYNQKGNGSPSLMKNRFNYDIKMNYDFLANDGSNGYPASYVGMALDYRDYLIASGNLKKLNHTTQNKIPLRLDFIMSDAKKSVLGYDDVVVTTVNEVRNILDDIYNEGVTNINSGLYGWGSGGVTLGRPYATDWNKNIGQSGDFKNLIIDMQAKQIDVSFAQDYININGEQVILNNDATTHLNGWHPLKRVYDSYVPISEFYYAKPTRSSEWILMQTKAFAKLKAQSTTIDGISNQLISDYNRNKTITLTQAKELIASTFAKVNENLMINAKNPNYYLLKNVDRNLQMDPFPTQYLIETDTVPFAQMVLSDSMELYAAYSNFSFYKDEDVLRMIDYNLYPSFIVSQKPSYLLSKTNSMHLYSTEYQQYRPIISSIYQKVNDTLSKVSSTSWINRKVLKLGVIENTYLNGSKIIINYQDVEFDYHGQIVEPLSCLVVGGD